MNHLRYKVGDKVKLIKDLDKILWGKYIREMVDKFDNIFTIQRMIDTDTYKLKEIDSHFIHHNLIEGLIEEPVTDPINSRFDILDL